MLTAVRDVAEVAGVLDIILVARGNDALCGIAVQPMTWRLDATKEHSVTRLDFARGNALVVEDLELVFIVLARVPSKVLAEDWSASGGRNASHAVPNIVFFVIKVTECEGYHVSWNVGGQKSSM